MLKTIYTAPLGGRKSFVNSRVNELTPPPLDSLPTCYTMQVATIAIKAFDATERRLKTLPPSHQRDMRLAKLAADRDEWAILARDPEGGK